MGRLETRPENSTFNPENTTFNCMKIGLKHGNISFKQQLN